MYNTGSPLSALPDRARERLLEHARECTFPEGTLLFEEGRRADRFWVLLRGSVRLSLRVPTRPPMTVDTLHPEDLVGCSWLLPPYAWQLGARTLAPVDTLEFDARAVRHLCDTDPETGYALTRQVAAVLARRLQQAHRRLLDLYGPYGTSPGTPLEEPA
ncbi:Crp/Fnr family transcriptional regulator [Streptomyces sp. JJ36]|uniref:Crp/Fnr family transcriptional regulator n=1 Tax=Streptomyces sp. JJ36 TaxID=2736645 RepID=UPI001F2C5C24|nr:cyclic nucleotide-binding domain-containing protein [Streptomyces sp. JJ36]MCF6524866.1 cyclic nucleotide-binding domain-containing protein [Streptomyces sp. JJ36]